MAEVTAREFSVWAPRAARVELLLPEAWRRPMTRGDDGWWRTTADAAAETTYAFSLDGGDPRSDPRGLRLPGGPHGWSQRYDPAGFAWTDDGWTGVDLSGAVVYELHVGAFTPQGSFAAAPSPRSAASTRRPSASTTSSGSASPWWS